MKWPRLKLPNLSQRPSSIPGGAHVRPSSIVELGDLALAFAFSKAFAALSQACAAEELGLASLALALERVLAL